MTRAPGVRFASVVTACPGCDAACRAGDRFCHSCGTALPAACSGCGSAVRAGDRFCASCGSPLIDGSLTNASVPPAESERKQVTVLFADVARSMELAERFGAEQWTELMARLFAAGSEAVARFGGTVDKFTGDGLMALFGAPVAQEDHALRACHAALALLDAAAEVSGELSVRVGLNSGEVIAGSVGASGFTAVGHTVGLAQRMEAIAEPGTVCLTGHTAALVAGRFRLRNLGAREVKGATEPVGVFVLEGATQTRRRGGSAKLVGRDAEWATLADALTAAVAGQAQVIGIVAEAGAGKSRLTEELAVLAAERRVLVRRTAGVSHATGVPLLPIRALFRNYFDAADTDSPEAVRDRIGTRLLELDPGLADELPLIFDFLDVADPTAPPLQLGPDARRTKVLDLLRRITRRRSENDALLLVLEDLHWFDQASKEFLEAWLPTYAGTRTLIVTNFRPEFTASWMARSYYRQIPLPPLDPLAVGDLLSQLLGADPELAALTEDLADRAGGNPFFLEEIVRGWATDGTLTGEPGAYRLAGPVATVAIPPTVQAVLAGRIDRLTPDQKSTLQAASVIGRVFSTEILALVVGTSPNLLAATLDDLCTAELIVATGIDEYRFWHPLTQEVAHGGLVGTARRNLHKATADAIAGLAPDRLDESAALIATHYEAAAELVEAARWLVRAGRLEQRRDFLAAMAYLRHAIEHLTGAAADPHTERLGLEARVQLLRISGRAPMEQAEADRLFAEADALAPIVADPVLSTLLGLAHGTHCLWSGDITGSEAGYIEGFGHAERSQRVSLRAFVRAVLAFSRCYRGPVDEAVRSAEDALALCAGDRDLGLSFIGYSVHGTTLFLRGTALCLGGSLDRARNDAQECVAHFEQRPMAEWNTWALALFSRLAEASGEPADVEAAGLAAAAAVTLAADSGNIGAIVQACFASGLSALLVGRLPEARSWFAEALTTARAQRRGLMEEAPLLSRMAQVEARSGEIELAAVLADEAINIARRTGARVPESFALLTQAQILRDVDETDARAAVTAGEQLCAEMGARTYAAFLAEERARLDGGDLAAVADGYAAIGATGHASRLRKEL